MQVQQPLAMEHYNGGIALLGEGLYQAVQQMTAHNSRFHITLVTATEYKMINKPPITAITIPLHQIYVLGIARKGNVEWLTVIWNHADVWRRSLGLGRKAYHVTLSREDNHELDKSVQSFLECTGTAMEVIRSLTGRGVDALDHLAVSLGEGSPTIAQYAAQEMIIHFHDSFKGYIRLAESIKVQHPKTALLAFAQAVNHNMSLLAAVASNMRKLRNVASYGPVATADEVSRIPDPLRPLLPGPWHQDIHNYLSGTLWNSTCHSRERAVYNGYEIPRFFSWLYPGKIAGMSTPRKAEDIDCLISMGFTHNLTLTEKSPLDKAWLYMKQLQHIYIPVPNYKAPTIEEMDLILDRVREGRTWLIHCGGGVGRAGTILACLMTMFGKDGVLDNQPQLDAKTAISLLRSARPNSLESEHQERFVAAYVSHRWKVAFDQSRLPEPVTMLGQQLDPKIGKDALNTATAKVLFLVGKPGSGKSWLASAISKRRGKTIIISQDDSGRASCERQLGRKHPVDTLVIFDRCNPRQEDRADWLRLIPEDRQTIAVYFDYNPALCLQRVNTRLNHPTLRAGQGRNAVDQMTREMSAPLLSEGFAGILTISSFAAAKQALHLLSPSVHLLKFPRTPHLLNTGSATDDDVVLADFTELTGVLSIEEKIDGANMGFSLDFDGAIRCQNRSHWVNSADHAQFKALDEWIEDHSVDLQRVLARDEQYPERYILYGEWVAAKHSVLYTTLPERFLAFDLYDRVEGTFTSRAALSSALTGTSIVQVPLIATRASITCQEVLDMLQRRSVYGEGKCEGVYIRFEDVRRIQTVRRGKVVRSDFIAGNDHWSKGRLQLNGLVNQSSTRFEFTG